MLKGQHSTGTALLQAQEPTANLFWVPVRWPDALLCSSCCFLLPLCCLMLLGLLLGLLLVALLLPAANSIQPSDIKIAQYVLADLGATLAAGTAEVSTYLCGGLFSRVARTGTARARIGALGLAP